MTTLQLNTSLPQTYRNNGQHLEQVVRYTLTGTLQKADNLPANAGTDCLQYSIKSARATICKGTDVKEHLKTDKAKAFIYATKQGIAYIMDRAEYLDFVQAFGTVTRESTKNGGAIKTRLGHETSKMLEWLAERA